MNLADWIDTATVPPRALPPTVDAALAYLVEALGHPLYTHWTLARVKRHYGSLAEAKTAQPAVLKLLLAHDAAVQYWERGRLRTVPAAQAPTPEVVLARVLHTHRRRFPRAAAPTAATRVATSAPAAPSPWLAHQDARTRAWLARAGRFAQPHAATNTLGATDDAQALALFLRDRAARSAHTLRAYGAELRRLMAWCDTHGHGPFSDLSRQQLLAYRHILQHGDGRGDGAAPGRPLAEATRSRALAVVASWGCRTFRAESGGLFRILLVNQ